MVWCRGGRQASTSCLRRPPPGARACPPPWRRTYRLSQNIKPLIWVECQVDKHSRSRTEYLVKARSQFKERSTATSVEILLPLPPDAISPTVRTSQVGGLGGGRGGGRAGQARQPRGQQRAGWATCAPAARKGSSSWQRHG